MKNVIEQIKALLADAQEDCEIDEAGVALIKITTALSLLEAFQNDTSKA